MRKHIAIFDMDGTLVDSMYQWKCAPANVLFQFGYQVTDEDEQALNRLGFYRSPQYLIDRYALPCTEEEFVNRCYELMLEEYHRFVLMRPNAKNYLLSLHKKGVQIAVLTASRGSFVQAMAEKFGLQELIDGVFPGNDLNLEKSQPEIYRLLFDHFGCTGEECLMFEDSAYALETAKQLGIDGVGVLDPVRPDHHDVLRRIAVRTVSTYSELLENDVF